MDWDTDTVSEDTTVDTVLATTASVRPMLSPRLLLILTFTDTEDTDWDTDTEDTTVDTVLATTASVRLRPSLRLLLILTFTATAAMGWDTDMKILRWIRSWLLWQA